MALNLRTVAQTAGVAATVACLSMSIGQQQADAFTLGDSSGWNYAVGSFNSGTGGSIYEMYSIAYKDLGGSMQVAINANMKYNESSASGSSNITYGDLFFNFSGKDFKTASAAGNLFGVRFATTNSESGAATAGVYSNVTAKSVTGSNSGWGSLSDYTNYQNSVSKGTSYGDLNSASSSYFDTTGAIQNSIGTGTKVSGLTMLAANMLTGLNFGGAAGKVNPGQAIGSQIFGFEFAKPKDFSGNFVANLFMECGNDGLAISGNAAGVPEPTTMAGLALAGGGLSFLKRRQKKANA